ncbi:MAG: OPT/YSL family transporter [Phycisphaerales bacterium]|nr:OPT/YSL family transporter [Phycisphaerales bacterium]
MNDSTEQRQPKFPQSEPLGAEFDLETYQVAPTFEELTEKLSEDATPEEKDHFWYTHIYRGDRVPQLTLRAVLMGAAIGMAMSISNLYTTIKLGWAFGVAITACILSYVIWNGARAVSGGRLSKMTILENNCMQSTASAAGYSTGGTIGTAFGALLLIQREHFAWYWVAPFVLLTAALGVFIAVPMKRQMINHEQLKFPSGIAAATTLRSLYSQGREAAQKANALIAALFLGMFLALYRTYPAVVEALHEFGKVKDETLERLSAFPFRMPELLPAPSEWLSGKLQNISVRTWGFEPSLLLVAAGMIVGLRVSLSMLAGSVLLFFVVSPAILDADLQTLRAHPEYVQAILAAPAEDPYGINDLYVPSVKELGPYLRNGGDLAAIGTTGNTFGFYPINWALWGGTSIMVFSSLTAVAMGWKTIVRAFKGGASAPGTGPSQADLDEMKAIEVPNSWFVIGMIPITIGIVILSVLAFQMSWWLGLISVIMTYPIALVCCRATGETDTTPIGAMGKVTQLVYAVLAPKMIVPNLMAAGTTAAAGGASADLLTDLKSGYLLGANPRKQFLAQFFGIFFGTLIIVPAWYLMVPSLERFQSFNPPAALMWEAVARALTQGLHSIPKSAQMAILVGGVIGIALPLIQAALPRKARHWVPSAMGLGLAWVVPWYNALGFAIGAVIAWLWSLSHKQSAEKFTIPVASGVVAGEALMAAMVAITATIVGFLFSSSGAA